jgi:trimeric autotransporter adhesin
MRLSCMLSGNCRMSEDLMRSCSGRLLACLCSLISAAFAQNSPVLTGCTGPAMGAFGSYAVTASGSGFAPGDTLRWNGSTVTTALVNSTQLTGSVPSGLVTAADSYLLTESSNGILSNCVLISTQPPPAISAVSPAQVNAGAASFVLTLLGTGFVSGSQAFWAGQPASTVFIAPGQLNVSISAAAVASSGRYAVTVSNPGGAASNQATFYVQPVVTSISPTLAVAGTPSVTIAATGAGFVPGDLLVLSRSGARQSLATTYLGPTGLSALVSTSMLQTAGEDLVFVSDGDLSSGIASNSALFQIANGPVISSLNDNMRPAGSSDYTVTINGGGFAAGAAVQWNDKSYSTPLATNFVSDTQVAAAVPARLMATPATAAITVVNPSGSVSNAVSFTVTPPGLSITGLAPASATAGGRDFTLAVAGSGFEVGAAVTWNGQTLATTVLSSMALTATVPAVLTASPTTATIAVSVSAGVSNPMSFRVAPALPVISAGGIVNAFGSLPSTAPGSLFSIWGTNLAAATGTPDSPALVATPLKDTSVTVNGLAAPLLYVSPTLINAQMPFEVPAGAAHLVVDVMGVKSAPAEFTVTATAPGVAIDSGSHAVAVNFSDGTLNSSSQPAAPGQYVILYLTGQGALTNPLSTGYPAPSTPLFYPAASVQATAGGLSAQVAAVMVPGWIGILQMNLLIPNSAPSGEQPLEISVGGVSANPTTLSIKSP